MNVCSNNEELVKFLELAANISKKHPVVVSRFIEHAKEVEMDAVAREGEIIAYAISEHIEFAGVHSGDATLVFPPQKLYFETIRRINEGHSFDESGQHLGRLRIAAQQIGREHGGLACQAPRHDTWLAAGSDMRLARQSQGQISGNQSHHHVEGRHALRDQRLLIELA